MLMRCRALIMAAVVAGSVTSPAVGQGGLIDCQQASRGVTDRRDPSRYIDALADLIRCPGAAAVLVEQLRNPPSDSLLFVRLAQASAKVPAREVTEALLDVAASESTPRRRRFDAIVAVASHYRPCLTLVFWPVATRLWRTYVPVGIGRLGHVDRTERVQPGVPELIIQRLETLRAESPDAIFRDAVRSALFQMRLIADAWSGC